jgi:hypothetical protein
MISPVSGPGKFAKREDLSRVKKIQREAKIQNATGGTYGQATQLQDIASGASTVQPQSVVNASPINTLRSNIPTQSISDLQGNGEPITTGVDGGTPGAGSEVLQQPVDAPDNAAILARAMFAANPTPQNRRLLEAFLQEGR